MPHERYIDLESIPHGVLVALEKLGRIERAVYVLHTLLQHSTREVALALNMTEHAVRDIARCQASLAVPDRPRGWPSRATRDVTA